MGLWLVGDNNEVVRSTKGPWVCGIGFIIKKKLSSENFNPRFEMYI